MAYVPPLYKSTRNPFLPDPPSSETIRRPDSGPYIETPPSPPPPVRTLKEYTYDLLNKSAKPWATLVLLGDAEHSRSVPAILEGSPVTGEIRLDLDSGDAIHAVLLSIKGQIITGATPNEMVSFIDLPVTLWARSMGDPRNPDGNKWSERLRGKYVWPFSIDLPPTVSLPFGGRDEIFRLPPTFFERHTRAKVEYDFSVRFTRTKLRSDHRLSTTLNYMPVSRPGPPSRLRQLAYQQHTALLGPDSDPEGWHTLPFVKTRGKLEADPSRSVEAKCKLSLATPLCYTRGTTIPCALVIECGDPQALDILTVPDAVVLRLRGKTAAHFGDVPTKLLWKEDLDHSELASWWPAADHALENDSTEAIAISTFRRMLKGEIHLKPDLITSSSIIHFRIEVCKFSIHRTDFTLLFPFDAPGYESLDTEPLIIEPVEIASEYASGPRPLTYSSPTSPIGICALSVIIFLLVLSLIVIHFYRA
ncbi:hypothetical protein B0H11DRAFT_2067547 [Mycena galericulata]|nr:hypothetical protein B0H11DRAFT_2067547 [Mycena galericulata]